MFRYRDQTLKLVVQILDRQTNKICRYTNLVKRSSYISLHLNQIVTLPLVLHHESAKTRKLERSTLQHVAIDKNSYNIAFVNSER